MNDTTNTSFDEANKKAFDFASDVCKQLITLATGILAITITFSKDLVGPASRIAQSFLAFAWVVYLASILSGIATLLILSGLLGRSKAPSIYSPKARWAAGTQIVLFVIAVGFTILFGIFAFGPAGASTPTPSPPASPAGNEHGNLEHESNALTAQNPLAG